MFKVGAHVSAAVSLALSLDRAQAIGAECTQIFISPPQQWTKTSHSQEEIQEYLNKLEKNKIAPNFIHAAYLINLASSNPEYQQKSIDWLIYALKIAATIRSAGVIFHIGSHKGQGFSAVKKQVINNLNTILENTPEKTNLILENSAGAGGAIGSEIEDLGDLINSLKDPRLKICLDTQHAFASGYNLLDSQKVEQFLTKLDQIIGLERLIVVHVNDSKTQLGSKIDRHENLGEGFIGKKGIQKMLIGLKKAGKGDLPLIIEVPGFAQTGPDQENISWLKNLCQFV